MKPLTFGTFCSGIGAPETAWTRLGWVPLFISEIEPFPCAMLAHHYPDVPNLGDMDRVFALLYWGGKRVARGTASNGLTRQREELLRLIKSASALCAGTPCQSFSVAGLRLGLSDPRGNLTLTFISIVAIAKPKYVVWENVPGVLSDDDGKTFQKVIDSFTQIGYVCDADILDAQYFGVPQRRRRVFVICVLLEDLLRRKTPTSDRIAAELLAQALQSTWAAIRPALCQEKLPLASETETEPPKDLLRERMRLLDALLGKPAVENLVGYLEDRQVQSMAARQHLELISTPSEGTPTLASRMATDGRRSSSEISEFGGKSIALSWRNQLDAIFLLPKCRTTSTSTNSTTDQEICSFAEVVLDTLRFIVNSASCSHQKKWSGDCWNLASSILTTLKDVTEYARSANSSLFISDSLRDGWGNCLRKSRVLADQLVGHLGNGADSKEVLSLPDRMRRNPPPRREKGKGFATDVAPCVDASGVGFARTGDIRGQDPIFAVPEIIGCLSNGAHNGGGLNGQDAYTGRIIPVPECGRNGQAGLRDRNFDTMTGSLFSSAETVSPLTQNPYGDNESRESLLVAHSLRGDGFDASEDGTGRGTPIVPVAFSCKDHGADAGEVCPTLRSMGHAESHANAGGQVAIAWALHSENSVAMKNGHCSPAKAVSVSRSLDSKGGFSQNQGGNLVSGPAMAVRRLTPKECERLQGLDDDFTAIMHRGKSAKDGPRYKAIDNSMAVPCLKWIGERIQLVDELEGA
jgi:DNA-cytosine methyltransferase